MVGDSMRRFVWGQVQNPQSPPASYAAPISPSEFGFDPTCRVASVAVGLAATQPFPHTLLVCPFSAQLTYHVFGSAPSAPVTVCVHAPFALV